jgi:hypothetical protein
LATRILVREGFVGSLKQAFQKLADNAKQWVMKKSAELAKKASDAIKALVVPAGVKDFLDSFRQQENGADVEQLVAALPFAGDLQALRNVENVDIPSMMQPTSESLSYDDARLGYVLAEEKYVQNMQRFVQKLNEAVIATVVSGWYAVSKTVITTCSLLIFALEGAAKVAGMLGIKKVEHFLESLAKKLEHVEEWFVEKVIFPAPMQYAAYLAFVRGKKAATKTSQDVLSYREFMSRENEETRESVLKGLKVALLVFIVIEALLHVAHAIVDFFKNISGSLGQIVHGVEHAGLEGRSAAKIGKDLTKVQA